MAVHELNQQADKVVPMEAADDRAAEIDLLELFYYLLENIKYIILAGILGALIAGVYSFFLVTPQYESTAKLYVINSNDSVVNLSDLQIGSYLASDYQEIFKTWEVHERVLRNLNLSYTYRQMQNMLSITNPNGTRILYITIKSPDPEEAALIANEYATVVRAFIAETMSTEMPNILSSALRPTTPVSPNKTRNVLLGGVIGGILSVGILVVLMLLDDKIKTTDDILKYTGLPTLAVVPISDTVKTNWQDNAASKRKGGRTQ